MNIDKPDRLDLKQCAIDPAHEAPLHLELNTAMDGAVAALDVLPRLRMLNLSNCTLKAAGVAARL